MKLGYWYTSSVQSQRTELAELGEPEDVREGDRHRREFLDPDRCPRRGRYTKSTLYYTVHLLIGRTNERLFSNSNRRQNLNVSNRQYDKLTIVVLSGSNSTPADQSLSFRSNPIYLT
ncbi:hypothetical protein Tsp_13845 [Trichinella spiralis]|uniref:hypothetical protein n=1 Tax=Trichinella spiralis TaxID=6334 RepID=UPI0001EFDA94|nr:hypothetical protein Tsp_13845 [Trichinella spiralis]